MTSTVLVDGVPGDGRLPVTDSSVLRGDGCFEVLRVYEGRPFALDAHLDRLEKSAGLLEIALPPRADIEEWVSSVSGEEPNGAVRIVVTRGSAIPGEPSAPVVVVFAHRIEPGPLQARLVTVPAPWHSAGRDWPLAGAKVLSYAPNLASTRSARRSGGDDALLVTNEQTVLEGPTFSVGWVVDGVVETPSLRLGILNSITRRLVLDLAAEAGFGVSEGSWTTARLDRASEAFAMSTLRQVQPVVGIDDRQYPEGPVASLLAEGFAQLVG